MTRKNAYRVEIMAIGSELLTPHFQDTNSLYLTQQLNKLGIEVDFKTIVGDDWRNLTLCIEEALSRADLLIAMGGLGPTKDDRTREAFARVLDRKLFFRDDILEKIRLRFKRRGMIMPEVNKKQAYIIDGSEVLENRNGTAPGLWLELGLKIIVLLPGPPQELKPMFEEFVWPKLQRLRMKHTSLRILKTAGLTESEIETLIFDIYPKSTDLKVITLAYPGQIEIHLSSSSDESQEEAEKNLKNLEEAILERLQDNVFSTNGEELEEVVGKLLKNEKKSLAVAESCTGGLLGHRLTNISGSSDYFIQGITAYSNESKVNLLGVLPDIIEKEGAVSSQVAKAMAVGVRQNAHTDFGIGITGIAGPSGGTPEKPVGLVFVALVWENGAEVTENLFLGSREAVKFQSSQRALDMVRRHLQPSRVNEKER